MIRIGIIGVGGIAGAHISGYSKLTEKACITALCDKIPERARGEGKVDINIATGGGKAVQATPYTDYREIVQDANVDAVDICLPTDLHADAAITALEAGKHVLSEKPMALSVADCDRMIAAAKASGRILMIAQCIRFAPEYVVLKRMVDSGQYGKLRSANFCRLSGFPKWSTDNWMDDPQRSGGGIFDLHIHDVDYVTFLLGMPQSVYARGNEDEKGIGYAMAEYRYAGVGPVYAEGGWNFTTGFPFRMTFRANFEHASLECDSPRAPLTVWPEDCEPYQPELPAGDLYTNEIAYFLDCIEKGVQPQIVTPFDARESIRLVLAEAESIRTGQAVAL